MCIRDRDHTQGDVGRGQAAFAVAEQRHCFQRKGGERGEAAAQAHFQKQDCAAALCAPLGGDLGDQADEKRAGQVDEQRGQGKNAPLQKRERCV